MRQFKRSRLFVEIALVLAAVHLPTLDWSSLTYDCEEYRPEERLEARTRESAFKAGSLDRIGVFSAYTSRPEETDASPYETADGTDLRETSKCIVANNALPFGTKIRIEGMGVCEIRDRMNPRYEAHHFDIYFGNDLDAAVEFGRRKLAYGIMG